tara:strand:+ start:763 stop:918 length:156 start_codon:yes stop_codon:yes gene_type:complete
MMNVRVVGHEIIGFDQHQHACEELNLDRRRRFGRRLGIFWDPGAPQPLGDV